MVTWFSPAPLLTLTPVFLDWGYMGRGFPDLAKAETMLTLE